MVQHYRLRLGVPAAGAPLLLTPRYMAQYTLQLQITYIYSHSASPDMN